MAAESEKEQLKKTGRMLNESIKASASPKSKAAREKHNEWVFQQYTEITVEMAKAMELPLGDERTKRMKALAERERQLEFKEAEWLDLL